MISSDKKHIAVVGRRNTGKSSLVNRLTGQDLVIVSSTPGTTTDPVKKSMELLPYGPVIIIDTAGIDDEGELGTLRINKTVKILSEADFAIFVIEPSQKLNESEVKILDELEQLEIPFITVINKVELGIDYELLLQLKQLGLEYSNVSCNTGEGIYELKEKLSVILPKEIEPPLVADLVKSNDIIVLVVPIDLGAPKGRLIMPQVQTLREALDEDTIVVVTKDKELRSALNSLSKKPKLVITDSQVVMKVTADVPDDILLTTFSILMARHKGDLPEYVRGLRQIENLQNGDKVLIAEACTHHAQEDDIGTVKIPRWLRNHTKKELEIEVKSGHDYPSNLSEYKLIIHCGGCMLTRRMMQTRIKQAKYVGIPIVNYGVAISYMHGAVPRALQPFEEALVAWEEINSEMTAK
ncbi:MAG: [FeFe] hydrogenase H-cluster maturation GTPase HydF [Melioribacteraceae bacterium]|nr:[FeFe] hydrogenase H-cluster maturation GTPase HydF [Melioribacteraceae bacterium]MCO6472213.1 [FeFe] hydrogenase H-cluster maturation GTPase HydF [Melioribacteraceae bacterium]MDD3557455.1 [FeFe] hydrogenase H-cluster maturation GTPase HydF [Melioribacteraceae bacterium]